MSDDDEEQGFYMIGVAYVDRIQEQKLREDNKNSGSNRGYSNEKGLLKEFYEYCVRAYLGTQRYSHCEITVRNDEGNYTAYGVFSDEGVFKKERTFSNPAYHVLFLSVTRDEYDKVIRFCEKEIGKPFDETGMRWSALWPKTLRDGWWCTAFTVAALNEIGILKHYPANAMDTDDIIDLLKAHGRAATGVLDSRDYLDIDVFENRLKTIDD